jgi:hypothetical protein
MVRRFCSRLRTLHDRLLLDYLDKLQCLSCLNNVGCMVHHVQHLSVESLLDIRPPCRLGEYWFVDV